MAAADSLYGHDEGFRKKEEGRQAGRKDVRNSRPTRRKRNGGFLHSFHCDFRLLLF